MIGRRTDQGEASCPNGTERTNYDRNSKIRQVLDGEIEGRRLKQAQEKRIWTLEDMHAFAAAAGARNEPMIRMLSDCGLRVGEMLAFRRALQDLELGIFRVKGTAWNGVVIESSREKNHDREGPIPPSTLALVRAMPARIDCEWLEGRAAQP